MAHQQTKHIHIYSHQPFQVIYDPLQKSFIVLYLRKEFFYKYNFRITRCIMEKSTYVPRENTKTINATEKHNNLVTKDQKNLNCTRLL